MGPLGVRVFSSAFDEGFAIFSTNNEQAAVEHFSQHLQLFPRHFECWMYRGISYEILGNQSAALTDYSEAQKWGTLCEKIVVRGLQMRLQGKKEEASNEFRQAKECFPEEGIAWHFYGIDRMGQDSTEEAKEAFEKAIAAGYRKSCVSRYFLGKLHGDTESHAEAITFYRDSLKGNPDMTICHIGLGDSLFETGALAEAKERYETAISLNPTQVQANLGLARILIREDQSDAAVQHFMKWADPSTLLSMSSSSAVSETGSGVSGTGSGGGRSGGSGTLELALVVADMVDLEPALVVTDLVDLEQALVVADLVDLELALVVADIEITSWKARAYGIFTRVGEVSEIQRVSAANE